MSIEVSDPRAGTALAGARVVAVTAALAAVLALPLPWAAQEHRRRLSEGIGGEVAVADGPRWPGWGLHGAGQLNGHRPLPLAVVLLLVVGTVALFVLCWLAWEADRARWPAVSALAVAAVLAVAGFPLLNALQDHSVAGRTVSADFGFMLWRVAVLAALAGAARAGVLQERRSRAERAGA